MAHDPVASDLPTLKDDEERFAVLADAFARAIVAVIPTWVARIVGVVAASADRALDLDDRERIADVGARLAAELAEPLRSVLVADVDSGGGSPLAVLRDGVGPITSLLTEMGLPAPRRDEFALRHFPADLYELGPTSFAELDQALHEPGLVWGASRAHIHLRRRAARSGQR